MNYEAVCSRLLSHQAGADPLKSNDYGHTPLDYARDPVVKKSLKQYGERCQRDRQRKEMEERRKFPLEQRLKEFIVGQVNGLKFGFSIFLSPEQS